MKKIFYFAVAACLAMLAGGCYEDKGNYDYSEFPEVTVIATSEIYTYNAKMGDHLNIPMTVNAEGIEESEMEYVWEIKNSNVFIEIEDMKGKKDFDRDLGPDDYFNNYATFVMRLIVKYSVRGYEFEAYSPLISVVLSGDTGLLVTHGNDTEVDLGLICNDIFLLSASTTTEEKISFDNYSSINGSKIPGKAIFGKQHDHTNVANAWIYVLTDQGMTTASAVTFEELYDYDDLFYSTPDYKYYQGKPEALFTYSTNRVLIDGGDIFLQSPPSRFARRVDFSSSITIPMPEYSISEHSVFEYGKGISATVGFDKLRRGFVKFYFNLAEPVVYYNSTKGPFNPNDMKADPLHFSFGGMANESNNFIGVFDGDDGELFIGEFNFNAPDEEGNTWARYKYPTTSLPDFENAKFYGFGITNAMCYYATDDAVYQYAVAGVSGINTGRKLSLGESGQTEFPFSGEITMMKVLRPSLNSNSATTHYQFYGELLLVGTYENGVGTLYAIHLHPTTGNALDYLSFTGFDRIYDANLKTR